MKKDFQTEYIKEKGGWLSRFEIKMSTVLFKENKNAKLRLKCLGENGEDSDEPMTDEITLSQQCKCSSNTNSVNKWLL